MCEIITYKESLINEIVDLFNNENKNYEYVVSLTPKI